MRNPNPSNRALLAELVRDLPRFGPYFSRRRLDAELRARGVTINYDTVSWHLWELKRLGKLNGAGRGWYSAIPDEPRLDRSLTAEVGSLLAARYPLLPVGLWSTLQLNPWMHHLLAEGVLFLSTDRDMLDEVAESLDAAGWRPMVNPPSGTALRPVAGARRILLRPLHSAAPPPTAGQASPEQVLVDLAVELGHRTLDVMDLGEFHAMAHRMASECRLNVSILLNYARKRKIDLGVLFGNKSSALFPEIAERLCRDHK